MKAPDLTLKDLALLKYVAERRAPGEERQSQYALTTKDPQPASEAESFKNMIDDQMDTEALELTPMDLTLLKCDADRRAPKKGRESKKIRPQKIRN
jgi:hypothetical protein